MEFHSLVTESLTRPGFPLFEFDLAKTMAIFGGKIDSRKKQDRSYPSDDVQVGRDLVEADPTRNQAYSRWILQVYASGGIRMWEDVVSRVGPALQRYDFLKSKNKLSGQEKNIFNLKSLSDLEDLVERFEDEDVRSGKDVAREERTKADRESKKVYEDGEVLVVSPRTEFASCFWGRDTRWCTAANTGNAFASYASRGTLFIFIPKRPKRDREKYQVHYSDSQDYEVADEKDGRGDFYTLAVRWPKAFERLFKLRIFIKGREQIISDPNVYPIIEWVNQKETFYPESDVSMQEFHELADKVGLSTADRNRLLK